MPRYFVRITEEELKEKIEDAIVRATVRDGEEGDWDPESYHYYNYKYLTPTITKDLRKVDFDSENSYTDSWTKGRYNEVLGYHTLDNGLSFLGVSAGGDWEWPVFFCVYWDGIKLRGYVPTDGNLFNTENDSAYGNDEEGDEENIESRFPGVSPDDLQMDPDKLIEDIKKRILEKK